MSIFDQRKIIIYVYQVNWAYLRDPKDPEATILVNHMGPGVAFGELGLIFRKKVGDCLAEEISSVLRIHGEDFRAIGIAFAS